jgi:hypothetical protein
MFHPAVDETEALAAAELASPPNPEGGSKEI